jgi:hypothetical protein
LVPTSCRAPHAAEFVTAGKLLDQLEEEGVVAVRSRGGAEVGHPLADRTVPVLVEIGLIEGVPQQVVGVFGIAVGTDAGGQPVLEDHVESAVQHQRRVGPAP